MSELNTPQAHWVQDPDCTAAGGATDDPDVFLDQWSARIGPYELVIYTDEHNYDDECWNADGSLHEARIELHHTVTLRALNGHVGEWGDIWGGEDICSKTFESPYTLTALKVFAERELARRLRLVAETMDYECLTPVHHRSPASIARGLNNEFV